MKVLFIKKVTLSHEFIFVFIWYFNGAIFLEKSCQKGSGGEKGGGGGGGGQKKKKKGNSHKGKWSIEGRLNPLPTVIGLYYIC